MPPAMINKLLLLGCSFNRGGQNYTLNTRVVYAISITGPGDITLQTSEPPSSHHSDTQRSLADTLLCSSVFSEYRFCKEEPSTHTKVDNTVRECKNQQVLSYLHLLVGTHRFRASCLCHLRKSHSHCRIGPSHGRLSIFFVVLCFV